MPAPFLSSQNLPSPPGGGGSIKSISGATGLITAAGKIGNPIIERAFQLRVEHDTAQAQSALNELRTISRGKFSELKTRQGSAANGIVDEYTNFYNKTATEFDKGFENDDQRKLFRAKAEAWRISDNLTLS